MSQSALLKNIKPYSAINDQVLIDIDITPMMNVFIILIPFLVSMAVFTHLAIIEFSLPPNAGVGLDASTGKPKLKMTVVVTEKFCALTVGERMLDSIPMLDNEYNFASLREKLVLHREELEIKDEAIVASRDAVAFKHVVKIMDVCRETGFGKVGLSSAPENPAEAR
jgi:biopolymer transport protein ExbD